MKTYSIPGFSKYYMDENYNIYSESTGRIITINADNFVVMRRDGDLKYKHISHERVKFISLSNKEYFNMKDDEIIKPVKGFEKDYLISNYGRIYSLLTNKFIKTTRIDHKTNKPYCEVRLRKNKQQYPMSLNYVLKNNFNIEDIKYNKE